MKICCVFNYNPLYRLPIFSAMDKELDCDFYFGTSNPRRLPVQSFDPNQIKGFKKFIKTIPIKFTSYIWHSGTASIFSRRYTHYILTGNVSMIINWLILLYAFVFRKKVYLWTHGAKTYDLNLKSSLMLKLFYKSATGILMYNHYNCQFMEALGIKRECLHVIHNSLDTDYQSELYAQLKPSNIYREYFGNDNPTLIYIGRIQKTKRTDLILDAMHLLKEKSKPTNLVVIGASLNDVLFEKKVKEYGLQNSIWMYGPCYDEIKNSELIYNADVCVSPGNVGLTCIHVLSYGTPVITNNNFSTQMPEYEAIVEGKTGGYFEEGNIPQMAEQIEHWISLSSQQREECRSVARKTILEEWSVDYQINLLKNLLK